MVALCVGCTANGQFQGAAWQAAGTSFIGDRTVLVVNPASGQSQWVRLTHYPPGTSIRAVPATTASESAIEPGTAVPIKSDPFAAIYIAGDPLPHVDSTGILRAMSSGVSISQQATINTAIKLTKKTWFVQLNPSEFPSYEGSMTTLIANANWAALQQAGIGWPVSAESNNWLKDLTNLLGVYTGHSFMVCDVFANGDSVCVVPDPFNQNTYTQTGPAKDANGHALADIGNRVAGGGGEGPALRRVSSPPEIIYGAPGSEGDWPGFECAYVDGELQYCIKQY